MRKTQKVEGLRLSLGTSSSVSFRVAAELDEACLLGMEFQTKLRESFAQLSQETFRVSTMLKAQDEIISEADGHYISVRLRPPPSLDPEVEHIVKVDIRQEWADAPALYGSHLALYSLSILQHAGSQPFLDEPHNALVRYSVLDKLHQPSVIEGSKQQLDILPTTATIPGEW